jgi:hypothetical protein
MTPAIKTLTLVLMLTLLLSGQFTSRVAALPASRPSNQAALPPECATRTVVRPLIIPSWVFVMNFDVIQAGNPLGCLIVFRAPRTPTHTISVACNVIGASVAFNSGQALFNGGHVRCPVNLKTEFAALSPTLTLTQSYDYPYFTITGVGRIEPNNVITQPFGNPIAFYMPSVPSAPPVGLFVPLSNSSSMAVITSLFNGIPNIGTVPFQITAGGLSQTWGVKHIGAGMTYTVTHLLGDAVNQTFSPRDPVSFWVDGGVFWVGGSSLGPPFSGVLDEVIVDPPDGGPPPGLMFLPIVVGLQ